LAAFHGAHDATRGGIMKKKIAWLFLVVIALVAVPVSHASSITSPSWGIDGTDPPEPPVPW
jgi:hypothetical protein